LKTRHEVLLLINKYRKFEDDHDLPFILGRVHDEFKKILIKGLWDYPSFLTDAVSRDMSNLDDENNPLEKDIIKILDLFPTSIKNGQGKIKDFGMCMSPLAIAIRNKTVKPRIVTLLLDRGCDVNASFVWPPRHEVVPIMIKFASYIDVPLEDKKLEDEVEEIVRLHEEKDS